MCIKAFGNAAESVLGSAAGCMGPEYPLLVHCSMGCEEFSWQSSSAQHCRLPWMLWACVTHTISMTAKGLQALAQAGGQSLRPSCLSAVSSVMLCHAGRSLTVFPWCIPQVWGGAADAAERAETGAVARMHSALIAVVAHLLTRLGAQALSEAQVRWLRPRVFCAPSAQLHPKP